MHSSSAFSQDLPADALAELPPQPGGGRFATVELLDEQPALKLKKKVKVRMSKSSIPYVSIPGLIKGMAWSIALNGKVILPANSTNRRFEFKVRIRGEKTVAVLKLISPENQESDLRVSILVDQYEDLLTELPETTRTDTTQSDSPYQRAGGRKKFSMIPSLGFTSSTYKESETPNTEFTMSSITFKLAARYAFNAKWDMAANAYLTTFALSKSIEDASVRYLGLNWRIGYRFAPWFTLHFGYFFTTMLVTVQSSPEFGFTNVTGPQLFPSFHFQRFSIYGKYSPITSNFKLLSLSLNSEVATGLSYTIPKRGGKAWVFALDYNSIRLDVANSPALSSNSFSLSAGYQF